jgi:hypothetical protein
MLWLLGLRQRERNHGAALRAFSQMVENLLPLMRRQRGFHEGANLVRVWMVIELERLTHV